MPYRWLHIQQEHAHMIISNRYCYPSNVWIGWCRPFCLEPSLLTVLALTFRLQQMTLEEAQILILRVLKQVMEEKLDQHNVQLAQVTKEQGFEILTEEKLQTLIETMMAQLQPAVPAAS